MEDKAEAPASATEALDARRVECIAAALAEAPAPTKKMTMSEALRALAPALRQARQRGHTFESLAEVLQVQGMKASARSVAQALRVGTAARPANKRKV